MKILKGKKLLIFDFDGTVANTSHMHATAFAQVLATKGISVDYHQIAGMKTLDAMRKCLDEAHQTFTALEIAELVAKKQQNVRRMICEELQPLPGVKEFLSWARKHYRLAMVSSGSSETVLLSLDRLGLIGWFDPLICADDVQNAKPSPEGFLTTLRLVNLSASEALVFEDSEVGFQAARLAGLDYIDVRHIAWPNMDGLKL